MAMQSSGLIKFSEIQTEFGGSNPIRMSEYFRGGAYTTTNNTNVPTSGRIAISNFYGSTSQFFVNITSNLATPQNLRTLAVDAGWDEDAPLVFVVDSGVFISSNTTATPALTVDGEYANGVQLINNGIIVGMGGAGGDGIWYTGGGTPGSPGGGALFVSSLISITNNGFILGGGGGGAGGAGSGNGAIGGNGGGGQTGLTNSPRAIGVNTSDTATDGTYESPGQAGSFSCYYNEVGQTDICGGTGGNGGAHGQPGQNSGSTFNMPGAAGGAGGYAVTGDSNITWLATGTRAGLVS